MPNGAPVDDVIVYRRAAERFLLVVNAGNIEKDFLWLQEQSPEGCALRDRSDEYALLALQGPHAAGDPAAAHAARPGRDRLLPLCRGRGGRPPGHRLAHRLHGRGRLRDLRGARAGRGALDRAARGGTRRGPRPGRPRGPRHAAARSAHVPLRQRHGRDHDAGRGRSRLDRLAWTRQRATSSAGRSSRPRRRTAPPRKLVGFEMVGRGIARHGYPVLRRRRAGRRRSPPAPTRRSCRRTSASAISPRPVPAVGTEFDVEVRGRRVAARVVPTPFYKRPR